MARSYTGIVQKGTKRAAKLGFPTVNIPLSDASVSGVYAARVTVGRKNFVAAAFADQTQKVLEAHLLDFAGDLYGKKVQITLGKKIREDQRFDTDAALRTAIAGDIFFARDYFRARKTS